MTTDARRSEGKRGAKLTPHTLEIQSDERAIARLAPELSGMSVAKGAAYVRHAIKTFQESCTPAEARILSSRLSDCQHMWSAQELTLPHWGNLAVLRTLQAEIAAQTLYRTAAKPTTPRPFFRKARHSQ